MKWPFLLALLAVTGCDRLGATDHPSEPKSEIGRWSIIPIANATTFNEREGHVLTYAWRVDSVTGTVEMCFYSEFPGQMVKTQLVSNTALICGHEMAANPSK